MARLKIASESSSPTSWSTPQSPLTSYEWESFHTACGYLKPSKLLTSQRRKHLPMNVALPNLHEWRSPKICRAKDNRNSQPNRLNSKVSIAASAASSRVVAKCSSRTQASILLAHRRSAKWNRRRCLLPNSHSTISKECSNTHSSNNSNIQWARSSQFHTLNSFRTLTKTASTKKPRWLIGKWALLSPLIRWLST